VKAERVGREKKRKQGKGQKGLRILAFAQSILLPGPDRGARV
jgi:hypothetical protein